MSDYGSFDAKLNQARQGLPLKRLMEQRGRGPANGNWKAFAQCPYCGKKGGSGLFAPKGGSQELFKCHHAGCPSGTSGEGGAWDEIGFLAHELGLSRKDAAITYLKEAGLWKEKEDYAPSVLPGQRRRKNAPPDQGTNAEKLKTETLKTQAEEEEEEEKEQTRAAIDLPSATGVAAPAVDEPNLGAPPRSDGPQATNAEKLKTETLKSQTEEEKEEETKVRVAPDGRKEAVAATKQGDNATVAGVCATKPAEDATAKVVDIHGHPVVQAVKEPGKEKDYEPDGYRALREFYSKLQLSEQDEAALYHKRGIETRTMAAAGLVSSPKSNKELLAALGQKFPWDELALSGVWLPEDAKRKKARRPNAQLYGAGIIGKLREGEKAGTGQWSDDDGNLWGWCHPILIPYFNEGGELIGLRPHKGGGRAGTLIGTPHVYVPRRRGQTTDHGPRTTDQKPAEERFSLVVITEGEFKALALWQVLGGGAVLPAGVEPIGVVAVPGISFGKHYEIREELDGWLKQVRARRVVVVYDNEEKGDPKLKEAFKPDVRKRFDAVIWARYLASDLARKVHVRGEVAMLPRGWRNEKGKADWDGALALIARGEKLKS